MEAATCVTCGNQYDKAFEVHRDGQRWVFDSFECAIQKLAPICKMCGCRIIGHGLESDEGFYCCANCANRDGAAELRDRA